MGLFLLSGRDGADFVVPTEPPLEDAVAANFEQFDGLTAPDNYDANPPVLGENYGHTPRPGAMNSPLADIVYTPGPIVGITGVLGGQPYPVATWQPDGGSNPDATRGFTKGKTFRAPQFRLGKNALGGQNNNGFEQTLALSEITNNPPTPDGSLASIIAGV